MGGRRANCSRPAGKRRQGLAERRRARRTPRGLREGLRCLPSRRRHRRRSAGEGAWRLRARSRRVKGCWRKWASLPLSRRYSTMSGMTTDHSLAQHFATEAYQNAWANHRLLDACARLSQEEFVAPRTSFFPSIKATLNHILTVDWYYLDILERGLAGKPPDEHARRFFDPREPFDRCEDLSREQH